MSFSTYSQCQIPCCYTGGFISAGAAQGELPEGQERVPWGMTVTRNSGLVATDGTCGFHLITHVTVGCGKVNCPQGKRRCPGVRPRRTASDENHIANCHGHHFI